MLFVLSGCGGCFKTYRAKLVDDNSTVMLQAVTYLYGGDTVRIKASTDEVWVMDTSSQGRKAVILNDR